MIGKNTLEETDKKDGKVMGVWKMTVAADGKTARGVYDDTQRGTKTEHVVMKQ